MSIAEGDPMDASGRVCLVTGANSGIGYGAALGLARRGASVIMFCRDRQRGEAARQKILEQLNQRAELELLLADLADFASVREAAREVLLRYDRLDALINCAGVFLPKRQLGPSGVELNLAIHVLGPMVLTDQLLDRLKQSAPSRLINLTGEYHRKGRLRLDDLEFKQGYNGFRAATLSQLLRVMITNEWHRRLAGSGVTANSVHPGPVQSNIQRNLGPVLRFLAATLGKAVMVTPEKGGEALVKLALDREFQQLSGIYFDRTRQVEPSELARDSEAAARVWEECRAIIERSEHS